MIQPNLFENIPDHRGQRRAAGAVFFAPPPAELGPLVSAESTLGTKFTFNLPLRLVMTLPVAAVFIYAGLLLAEKRPPDESLAYQFFAFIAGAAGAAVVWYYTRFNHACTYVGEHGFAIFTLSGSAMGKPVRNVLLFKNAAELRATQTRMYMNGVYTQTTYDYRWVDDHGRRVARLNGRYMGENRPPKEGDRYHFASAAEIVWSEHVLARAAQQLKDEGSIAFRVDAKRVVRVGPEFMEFHFGDEPVRVHREEIGSVTLGGGEFSFKHKDAKWYRNAGKYRFGYGEMANGKVFLLALEKLMGYSFNEAA
jgi:hypothetical protein